MKMITTVLRFGSINFLRFLAALCRFFLVKKNCKNQNWTLSSPPKTFVDARLIRLPQVYHQIVFTSCYPQLVEQVKLTVHDQRIGPFTSSAEDEFNSVTVTYTEYSNTIYNILILIFMVILPLPYFQFRFLFYSMNAY